MKSCYLLILVLFTSFLPLHGQELNAKVKVVAPRIQSSNKRTLEVLETAIRDFLNSQRWSDDRLTPEERIECNFFINITEWDGSTRFKAEAQVQSTRPVYGSTYLSTILNISEPNFAFTYTEGQALDFSEQGPTNNLTALLAFYANVIVGLDADTFSKLGGSPNFTKVQTIVNNMQNEGSPGWKATDGGKNRYWLAENLRSKAYLPIREALYDYHLKGLDQLSDDAARGRKVIAGLLPNLLKADRQKQGAMLETLFFTAKADELVNVISGAEREDRLKAYSVLVKLDPANQRKYDQLKN